MWSCNILCKSEKIIHTFLRVIWKKIRFRDKADSLALFLLLLNFSDLQFPHLQNGDTAFMSIDCMKSWHDALQVGRWSVGSFYHSRLCCLYHISDTVPGWGYENEYNRLKQQFPVKSWVIWVFLIWWFVACVVSNIPNVSIYLILVNVQKSVCLFFNI